MVNKQADRSRERAREDYLKAIFHLGAGAPVRATDLARFLRVSRASVSKFRRVLERESLIRRSQRRVDALTLTKRGLASAVRMVRRHRLVETFLHNSLGVPLERVHRDAEKIEHTISDDVARRLSDFLGNPAHDPHGHPIPASPSERAAAHDKDARARDVILANVAPGRSVVVTMLDDEDDDAIRRLSALGILPGFAGTVVRNDAAGTRVRSSRTRKHVQLLRATARRVRVTAL